MLDQTLIQNTQTGINTQHIKTKRVLTYEKNERMGGTVPVWKTVRVDDPAEQKAAKSKDVPADNISALQGQKNHSTIKATKEPDEFGFGDLIDMVNPLHHLPIIGDVYRDVTGDTIKPASKILGGIVFGGPIGGGSALVNVIVEHETGTDIAGNFVKAVNGESITLASEADSPEQELEKAVKIAENPDVSSLPGSAIGFVDLGHGQQRVYEKIYDEDDRIAGSMISIHKQVKTTDVKSREPITQVRFDSHW
jgi:hypothetical protein